MFYKSSGRAVLITVALAQFLVSLDLSVMNVGLPSIQAALGFEAGALSWVIHAYALTFGGLLLLGGRLADRYGRRRMLLIGLALFAAASLAGGFAVTPGQLVVARAVQGVGAAALAPAALALLTATFPSGRARVRAFGVWSAMNATGGAVGVLAGGLLTQYAGWQWVMWVSVPMAVVPLGLTWRAVPTDSAGTGGRADVLGAVLVTAGMGVGGTEWSARRRTPGPPRSPWPAWVPQCCCWPCSCGWSRPPPGSRSSGPGCWRTGRWPGRTWRTWPSVARWPRRSTSCPRSEEHTSELQSRGHLVC